MDRQQTQVQKELNDTVDTLIQLAFIYDKKQNEKPGDFIKRIKHKFPLLHKLKSKHFKKRIK